MSHPGVQPAIPHGAEGIRQVGHRRYVGGLWHDLGRLQFDHMLRRGLRPEHVLFDVGCGCLRGGVRFIPYLDAGNYYGIDKEARLVEAGLDRELDPAVRREKRPTVVVSDRFEFERFGDARADYALAQSLFTHLTADRIETCLTRLRPFMKPGGLLCATFFETSAPVRNRTEPHDHGYFAFTAVEMAGFGERAGWKPRYIGSWEHPRGQRMMHYRV